MKFHESLFEIPEELRSLYEHALQSKRSSNWRVLLEEINIYMENVLARKQALQNHLEKCVKREEEYISAKHSWEALPKQHKDREISACRTGFYSSLATVAEMEYEAFKKLNPSLDAEWECLIVFSEGIVKIVSEITACQGQKGGVSKNE